MHDAAAVRRPAHGDVVEPEAVEHGGDGLDHVRGPEHVAAQIEDDVVSSARAGGGSEPPASLAGRGHEVLGQRDLAEVLAVVEAHRAPLSIPDSGLQQPPCPAPPNPWPAPRADLALLALERLHRQRPRVFVVLQPGPDPRYWPMRTTTS